jgi:hypothetical protein
MRPEKLSQWTSHLESNPRSSCLLRSVSINCATAYPILITINLGYSSPYLLGRTMMNPGRPRRKVTYRYKPFVILALESGAWLAPHPGRFTPRKYLAPIVQEAGWASGPFWTARRNLALIGFRSPDSSARRESLSRSMCESINKPKQNESCKKVKYGAIC